LGRVINPEGSGKERTKLSKSIILALRELMRQTEPDDHSRDLAAFIALALNDIYQTVDVSVTAWEKKGYWVKADRFRMEWEWSASFSEKMRKAILSEDWATIAATSVQIAQKLMNVDVPIRHWLGTPWEGAYQELMKK